MFVHGRQYIQPPQEFIVITNNLPRVPLSIFVLIVGLPLQVSSHFLLPQGISFFRSHPLRSGCVNGVYKFIFAKISLKISHTVSEIFNPFLKLFIS